MKSNKVIKININIDDDPINANWLRNIYLTEHGKKPLDMPEKKRKKKR